MDATQPDQGVDGGIGQPGQLARGSAVGRYLVTGLIGKGGMGEVYAAYDPELNRKIALKLLRARPGGDALEGQARLLREAQALASLSDPHIVVIYDVGTFAERVFLAMEFVDGHTVGYWLLARPRTWREIVTTFAAGGSGLASAHRSGIVHRDFKLDNVMITHDGQVRVMDFGLARTIDQVGTPGDLSATAAAPSAPGPVASPAATIADNQDQIATRDLARLAAHGAARVSSLPFDSPLTVTGALIGTPAYMAPEQHTGGVVDPRTDQFSFCVALYEGLYGERPFGGKSILALTANVIAGRVRAAPASAKVPGWLRRVVLRGLRADRAARYPSMEALLVALRQDPAHVRRTAMGIVLAVALLLLVGIGVGRSQIQQRTECLGGGARLAGVWEPPDAPSGSARRNEIQRAFLATGRPYAADSFIAVAAALDSYVARWRDMYRDACEATNVRGEQSAEVLDLRMGCLDQRLAEARTLTALFVHPDADVVMRSAEAVQGLKPIEPCADIATLRAVIRMPENPAERRKLVDLRARLAAVKATVIAGRYQAATAVASQLVDEALRANYAPVTAETLLQLGEIQTLSGQAELAEHSYEQAIWLAEGSHHDEAVLEAADQLISITGFAQGRHRDGERWASFTDALLRRLGPGHGLMEAWRANNLATVYYDQGRLEDALRMFGEALAMKVRAVGARHFDVAMSLDNEAEVLYQLGRTDEALQKSQQALDIFHETLGPGHPRVAGAWASHAEYLNARGDYTRANTVARHALEIFDGEPAANPAQVATALIALGVSWYGRGLPALAIPPLERALDIGGGGILDNLRYGTARFALARALTEAVGPTARSLALAIAARGDFGESQRLEERRVRVEQWIKERRRGPGKPARTRARSPDGAGVEKP